MRKNSVIALAVVAAGSLLTVQTFAQSRGQGQERAQQQRINPTQRLMQMDTDGDGKLSKSELPERFADRIFDAADGDADGFLTEAEVDSYFQASGLGGQDRGGQGRGGQGRGDAGDNQDRGGRGGRGNASGDNGPKFGRHMGMMNRSLRQLTRSDMTKGSMEDDLKAVETLQTGVVGAKSTIQQVPMSPTARTQFEGDQASYRLAFRTALNKTLMQAVELEAAILSQDPDKARRILEGLQQMQDRGHSFFQGGGDDGDGDGDGDAPRRPRRTDGDDRGFGSGDKAKDDKDKDKDKKDNDPRRGAGG